MELTELPEHYAKQMATSIIAMDYKMCPSYHNKNKRLIFEERLSLSNEELYELAKKHDKKSHTGHNLREKLLKTLHQRKIEKSDP
jgi:hypothetical protein